MSIDRYPLSHLASQDKATEKEALKQSAQNFLIDIGLAVTEAKKIPGLVINDPGYYPYVNVANHKGAIARIVIKIDGDKEYYSLVPELPRKLVSLNHKIEQEYIYVSQDSGELTVKRAGRVGYSDYGYWTDTVNDPVTGSMLEEFVRDLLPISEARFMSLKSERFASMRPTKMQRFSKKLGILFGFK